MRTAALVATILVLTGGAGAENALKISGVVMDASSRAPIANAVITYVEEGRDHPLTTATDAGGGFEIFNATRGIVTVQAPNYATMKRSWPPRKGGLGLDFSMPLAATASGRMFDAVTRRAADGLVTLVVSHPLTQVSVTTRTRNGEFRFDDLPPGPAMIYAHGDGFAPYYSTMTIKAGKRHNANVPLLLESAARGVVLRADGEPAVTARVRVAYPRNVPGSGILENLAGGNVTADEDGRFRIGGLLPDTTAVLQAELDGQWSDITTFTVDPGMMRTGVVLRMQ